MPPLFFGSTRAGRTVRETARKERGDAAAATEGQARQAGGSSGINPADREAKRKQGERTTAPLDSVRPGTKVSLTPPHPAFWQEVGATATCGLGLRPNFSLVGQWVLVLSALNIPHRLIRQGGDFYLYAPVMHAQRAEDEISAYLFEDLKKPGPPRPLPKYENSQASLTVLLGLAIFFGITAGWFKWRPLSLEEWARLGGLDAGRAFFEHEWYRVCTALTLHADSGHLLGNLFFGGLAAMVLCRQIGTGFGWLLILLSGILGNTLITVIRNGPHVSIGSSTAFLGVMGVLCGFTFFSTEQRGWRRIILPLAAALAWLAFLGSEGENTDLGAHFTGMLCGLPLGMAAGFLFKRKLHPSAEIDRICGAVALAIVALAWFTAFAKGSL